MSWLRLDDGFGDRSWDLTDRAVRLHIAALAWSNRTGAGGFVPRNRLAAIVPTRTAQRAATELVTAGWWAEEDGGWRIRQDLAEQFSPAEVVVHRKIEALRKRHARHVQLGSAIVPDLEAQLRQLRGDAIALREEREASQ